MFMILGCPRYSHSLPSRAILMGPQWASHGPKWAPSKSFLAFSIKTINCSKPKNNHLVLDVTKQNEES